MRHTFSFETKQRQRRLLPLIAGAALVVAGCTDDTDDSPGPAGVDGGADALPAVPDVGMADGAAPDGPVKASAVRFEPCPASWPAFARQECAVHEAAFEPSDPTAGTIELGLVRVRQTGAKGQLWLLDGGPGGTGLSYLVPTIRERFLATGYDLYIPIFRGSLYPVRLSCGTTNEGQSLVNQDPAACLATLKQAYPGKRLEAFRTEAAAADVAGWMQAFSVPGQKVAVWGGSYGTLLAQHLLRVAPPGAIEAMILDGVLPMGIDVSKPEGGWVQAALERLELCDTSPACRASFGGRSVRQVLEKVAQEQTCAAEWMMRWLGDATFLGSRGIAAALATLRRMDRCGVQERAELARLEPRLVSIASLGFPSAGDELTEDEYAQAPGAVSLDDVLDIENDPLALGRLLNDEILYLVAHNDLLGVDGYPDNPVPPATPVRTTSFGVFSDAFEGLLPRRTRLPSFFEIPPAGPTSVLVFSGGLDLPTPGPWAKRLTEAWPSSQRVFFPFGSHVLSAQADALPVTTCAANLMKGFLENPAAPVATSCVDAATAGPLARAVTEDPAAEASLFGP